MIRVSLEANSKECIYCGEKATHILKYVSLFRNGDRPVCHKCGSKKFLELANCKIIRRRK